MVEGSDMGGVELSPVMIAVIGLAIVGMNVLTWGVYRWDKAQARSRGRRVPEQTLLTLAGLGGIVGAFMGVYGHRQRHKAQKPAFLLPLYGIAAAYLVLGALVVASRIR